MIDEKFLMVVENFIEFEQQLHVLALRQAVYLEMDRSKFVDAIFIINRRLMNLLSACRLYLDQVRHDLHLMFGNDSVIASTFKAACSHEFDTTLGYMMMESAEPPAASQYRRPTPRVSRHRQEYSGQVRFVQSITPAIRLAELRENTRLSRKIREHLATIADEKKNITPWIREYVEGLNRVHTKLHQAMDEEIDQWAKELTSVLERGRTEIGESVHGYIATREGHDEVHVFPDFIDRQRVQSRRSRSAAAHVTALFVTTTHN